MTSNELPQEAFGLVEELFPNSCEAMMAFRRYFDGVSLYSFAIDETLHCFTSGQSWQSEKYSHELQCSPCDGMKSSRSTPST